MYDTVDSSARRGAPPVGADSGRRSVDASDRSVAGSFAPVDPPVPRAWTHEAAWTLGHSEQIVGRLRAEVRNLLRAWGIGTDAIDNALLVQSELVTNAIEHALPPIILSIRHDSVASFLRLAVYDGGPSSLHGPWSMSCAPEECGRGMTIVRLVATRSGERCPEDGLSLHWAEISTAA